MTKILAVSDQVVNRIYTLATSGHFREVDLIFGCGDLPYTYLEYLVSILNIPLYYVPGNHDPVYNEERSLSHAEGGVNLDLQIAFEQDLFLAGFGGCIRYRPDGVNQYTQRQAFFRACTLILRIWARQKRLGRSVDVLITHSPPFGIHDEESLAHEGLKALNFLINTIQPRYHFHGHTHFYRHNLEDAVTKTGRTTIMNVFPYKVIEIEDIK